MTSDKPEHIEEIVRRARLGDSEAFGVLYERYFTPLYRYLYFRVAEKQDAEDMVQEVFVKAYESFHRYEPAGSPLAYFYTIARNHLTDHYRKKKPVLVGDEVLEEVMEETESAEEVAAKRDEIETLKRMVAKLPEGEREAVLLRFVEGLSTKEIARMLGKSEVAVRQLQSRGLRSVRNML